MGGPNFLLIIVDEWRYQPQYESDELKEWCQKNLEFYSTMKKTGIEFHNHYTNTTACSPSRVTLQTGVYPSVHGVVSTDAVAKTSSDKDMIWLKPFTVPTIGNYMTELGYKTVLKGKWHVSDATIRGLSGDELTTFDIYGNPIKELEDMYREKNTLFNYGYNEWIGPEYHGRVGINAGSSVPPNKIGRDEKITSQALEALDNLDKVEKPWFLCLNYLNPHDIVLFGVIAENLPENFDFKIDETLPHEMFTTEFLKTLNENLRDKPSVQESYRDLYGQVFQPVLDIRRHWQYYYTLMKHVDQQLMKIWNRLITMRTYSNTITIFTSDHGDLLGSHGRMFQKWYQSYQETIHVPLLIASSFFESKDIHDLTSHIDILPTILDLVGANQSELQKRLSARFSLAVPLHGNSLMPLIRNQPVNTHPVYFYTEDNATKGENQRNALGITYRSVVEPSCTEAIIANIDGELWKYTSYYSKGIPYLEFDIPHELYNISQDPLELTNLYRDEDFHCIKWIRRIKCVRLMWCVRLLRWTWLGWRWFRCYSVINRHESKQSLLKEFMAEYSFRYRLMRNM